MANHCQTDILLPFIDRQIDERFSIRIGLKLGGFPQEKIHTVHVTVGSCQVQRGHPKSIDAVDQMRMRLQNRFDRGHVTVSSSIVQRSVAFETLAELGTFMKEQLHHTGMTIPAGEMQRCLPEFVRFIENTFETGRIQQLPTRVVPTVSKDDY